MSGHTINPQPRGGQVSDITLKTNPHELEILCRALSRSVDEGVMGHDAAFARIGEIKQLIADAGAEKAPEPAPKAPAEPAPTEAPAKTDHVEDAAHRQQNKK
jgi:hypothetical protein